MSILRKAYFSFLREFYWGEVSPAEARWAYNTYEHRPIFRNALVLRGKGLSFQEIAEVYGDNGAKITRERARQLVMKGVRQAEGYK